MSYRSSVRAVSEEKPLRFDIFLTDLVCIKKNLKLARSSPEAHAIIIPAPGLRVRGYDWGCFLLKKLLSWSREINWWYFSPVVCTNGSSGSRRAHTKAGRTLFVDATDRERGLAERRGRTLPVPGSFYKERKPRTAPVTRLRRGISTKGPGRIKCEKRSSTRRRQQNGFRPTRLNKTNLDVDPLHRRTDGERRLGLGVAKTVRHKTAL